ncbi:nucleotidyltransferase domain-containing protein [Vibrio sp.]|uniref:nucleotidyltransferase domain-containing protein n=1 Tax=Vibrio sp. TaxID=678 RepID=UPI003D107534
MDYFLTLCKLLIANNQDRIKNLHLQNFTDADWAVLFNLSKGHRVSPILYDRLNALKDQVNIPESIITDLRQDYLLNAVRNTIYFHEGEIILAKFSASGIPVIVLKGLYLVEEVYQNAALRSMSDLDFLVRKSDIPRAIIGLKELGYNASTYFNPEDENADLKHVPPFIKGDGLFIELHWTILEEDEPFDIDTTGMWERAQRVKILGFDVLSLSLEDLILHLSIHFTYQHQMIYGLRGLFDIALVLERNKDGVDWQTLVKRAKEWGCGRVISLTLHMLEEFLSVSIPDFVYSELTEQPLTEEILSQARLQLMKKGDYAVKVTPDLASLSDDVSAIEKLKIIFRRIALPKRTMARLYNVEPGSLKLYVYYPVRFYQLLKQYAGSAWQILIKKQDAISSTSRVQSVIALKEWLGGRE